MDNQKTESLAKLCKDIEDGNVKLPEFQRDFVWEVQKTYDLFDSYVKDIFVGSLIYGIPSFDISVRDIDKRPRSGKGSRRKLEIQSYTKEDIDQLVSVDNFRLLLDGQQRATSIYRALLGHDPVFMILRLENELDESIRSIDISKRTIDQMIDEFRGDVPEGRVGIKLSDVYQMLRGEMPREKDRVKPFILSTKISYVTEDDAYNSNEFNSYLTQAKNLEKMFNQEKLVSYYLLNTDQEKFALFFERSNSKGIQLSFIDILAAKLYRGFNLRQHMEEFKEDNPDLPFNREVVVRAISYVVSEGKDTGRSYILGNLTHDHFSQYWTLVTNLYRRCYEYLAKNHMIVAYSWLPYENMLIPLMMFLRHISRNDFANISEPQKRLLHLWYWLAIMARRYSSAAQTYVLEDAKVLEALAHEDYSSIRSLVRKLNPSITSVEDLLSIRKKNDAVYKGILNLVSYHARGVIAWENGAVVSGIAELDDHHIFPSNYLKKNFKDENLDAEMDIDCVINRCLIPKLANQKASDKAPSIYLGELKKRNANIVDSLSSSLIPEGLILGIFDDSYDEFLKERGQKIIEVLNQHVFDSRSEIIKSGI